MLREEAARGCPCPGAGVASDAQPGWRSGGSIERAKAWRAVASVRRRAWAALSLIHARASRVSRMRIFRIDPGSVMNAISRISPPHPGHCLGNSSPTRAVIFKRCTHRPTRRGWQVRSRGSRIAGLPQSVAESRATELTSQQYPRCAQGGS
jgi:hypothetical protein